MYDKISSGYDELYGEEQINKLNLIKKNIKIKKTDKLLDVGCGTGLSSDFDCDVTGIDPSSELLKLNKHEKIVQGSAENLHFSDNSFDIVVSVTAIHNFEDIEKGISEMKRVGKDRFVFSILKRSKKSNKIKKIIKDNFKVSKEIEEEKDVIFVCSHS